MEIEEMKTLENKDTLPWNEDAEKEGLIVQEATGAEDLKREEAREKGEKG